MMREDKVIRKTIAFLKKNGWKINNEGQKKHNPGIDIRGHHAQYARSISIEAKGDGKFRLQAINNGFPQAIGQVVSKMEKRLRGHYYGIAIPSSWETQWKKKIKKMEYAWKLLKIRLYLVHEGGYVEVKNWKQML